MNAGRDDVNPAAHGSDATHTLASFGWHDSFVAAAASEISGSPPLREPEGGAMDGFCKWCKRSRTEDNPIKTHAFGLQSSLPFGRDKGVELHPHFLLSACCASCCPFAEHP